MNAERDLPLESTEQIELNLLLRAIHLKYGYNFSDYAPASLTRRVRHAMMEEGVRTMSGLQEVLLHDEEAMGRFLAALSVNVTAMFRDAHFYNTFRVQVLPLLRTYPSVRIWHAGCATGEEVFSMAILLHEAGLYARSTLYGTDISERLLADARRGWLPIRQMKSNTQNYLSAGGKSDFSSYYTASQTHAMLKPELLKNIYFSAHNLVSDGPFNEFHVVLCRNVMIYFNNTLRERVLQLLDRSMGRLGILGIGSKESLQFSSIQDNYIELAPGSRVYRRIT